VKPNLIRTPMQLVAFVGALALALWAPLAAAQAKNSLESMTFSLSRRALKSRNADYGSSAVELAVVTPVHPHQRGEQAKLTATKTMLSLDR